MVKSVETEILIGSDERKLAEQIDIHEAAGWRLIGPVSAVADPVTRGVFFVATLQIREGEVNVGEQAR